jgi:hypothetical protein
VATAHPAVPDRRHAHALADLVAAGVPLGIAAKGLGLRPQAVRNVLYQADHGGSQAMVEFASWIADARTERATTVETLISEARLWVQTPSRLEAPPARARLARPAVPRP